MGDLMKQHSNAEIDQSHHHQQLQQRNLECPQLYGAGICQSEASIASEVNGQAFLLEGAGMTTNDEDESTRLDHSTIQPSSQGERLNAIDSDLSKMVPVKRTQLQVQSCDSKFSSDDSTTSVITIDSYTVALPRTISDGSNTISDGRQVIHNRLDHFLKQLQKKNDSGAEKLPSRQERLIPRVVSPVQHRLGTFALKWGKDFSSDNSHEDPEAPSRSPSESNEKPSRDGDRVHIHLSDQKMPASIQEECKAGIASMAAIGTREDDIGGESYPRQMAECQDNPHRVSLQYGLSSTSLNARDSFQESIASLGSKGTIDSDERTLHMVNDDSVSGEEGGMDDALIDSLMCKFQPIPFVPTPSLGGNTEDSPSLFDVPQSTGMDKIFPFDNIFSMEDLQQDFLACNEDDLLQKRSLETKDDSLPPAKRFKSYQDGEQKLSRDGILKLKEIFPTATNVSKPLSEGDEQSVVKPVKTKRNTTKLDTARSIEFSTMYKQCQSFSETHGHCAIPVKFPANPDLADWAKKIRTAHARISRGTQLSCRVLSQEQILELNKIGFCWNLKEHVWNTTFESLRDQVQKHGVAGGSHTKWLKTQRKRLSKNKLTSDQAQKISSLKFSPFIGFPTTLTWV